MNSNGKQDVLLPVEYDTALPWAKEYSTLIRNCATIPRTKMGLERLVRANWEHLRVRKISDHVLCRCLLGVCEASDARKSWKKNYFKTICCLLYVKRVMWIILEKSSRKDYHSVDYCRSIDADGKISEGLPNCSLSGTVGFSDFLRV